MDANISELDALQSSLPLLTERQLGESYGSMKNRLQKMKQPSEFGGIFEIIALAYLTETQISIHELGSESRYRLTACIPLSSESCGLPQIHLLHEVDTRDQPGHFDLLLNNQKSSVIDNEKSVCMYMYDSYQGSMPFYNSLLQLAVSHEVVSMCTFSECSCHCTNSLIIAVQWCRTIVHDQTNILFPLQQKYKGSMLRSYEDFSSACAFVDAVDISQDTPHDLDCQTRIYS